MDPAPSSPPPSSNARSVPERALAPTTRPEGLRATASRPSHAVDSEHRRGRYFLRLCVGALGVVYGDIGTSPLYAIRECFHPTHGLPVTAANILGLLSLIAWSLVIVITAKYLAYVLRADNHGEGGVLSLMALALGAGKGRVPVWALVTLGLFGAALLYGDGMITPAISILGALEGLVVATSAFEHWVVPITIVVLVLLFLPQSHGTARVGAVFGPVMLVWFLVIGALGVVHIVARPDVLSALSPHHAVRFFLGNGFAGFVVLGSVFLVVTGGEALYADMGHFGAKPIRWAWLLLAGPALLLNYFGQGALLLADPGAVENPFFLAAPRWALYPLVVLSVLAAVIASQAVISGAFSLTRQAIMLGFWPRVDVRHTSAHEIGQIYVPSINWMLLVSTIALVLGFRTSSNLAAAYGIAVTTTMVITTLLAYVVARHQWGWSAAAAGGLTLAFLCLDVAFFGANALKIGHGGWFPLVIGAGIFLLMLTWKRGREILGQRIRVQIVPLEDFWELLRVERPARVPGAGVFMTSNADGAPPALMQNFLLNRVVHQEVVLLTVVTTEQPRVPDAERVTVEELEHGFKRVIARYGFMEQPDVPALLAKEGVCSAPIEHCTFFLGRETVLPARGGGMARFRQHLFAFMTRNSQRAATFFNVPPERVMEIGSQVSL
jgi:KUP system potassium uptake protein